MLKKIKIAFLKWIWLNFPVFSRESGTFLKNFFTLGSTIFYDWFYFLSPFISFLKNFLNDIRIIVLKYFALLWGLVTQHRLVYILRLVFLIFLLYKPTLIELDSVYWILSIFFYLISNNIFFVFAYVLPFSKWAIHAPTIKFLIFFCIFPALFSSRRLKKRLKKRKKIFLEDDEVFFIFHWAERLFVFTFYFLFCYVAFFLFSFLVPVLYLLIFDNVSFFSIKAMYFPYLSTHKLVNIFFSFSNYNFFFSVKFFFNIFTFSIFYFFHFLLFPFFINLVSYYWYFPIHLLLKPCIYMFVILKLYSFYIFCFLKNCLLLITFCLKHFKFDYIIDIYKNFLFSDNFFIFLFSICGNLFKVLSFLILYLIKLILHFLNSLLLILIPSYYYNIITSNFSFFRDYFVYHICSVSIPILDSFVFILNTYLKDLSFFGLLSTWYEYLSQGVQRGILKNSLLNWLFLHIYASMIAFWFLDFDFKVSVKTPPKTPNTLLKEAKKTQDWIPQNMDFLTLQTNETKIYFAMLDISFEHVESLHFIYGDFEYIDEEYDQEDETPDEEEFWNDSEETLKVREIIESDLGFTKRPNKMSDGDPLDSKSSLERHYLSEIVGEPELMYIEEPLKWAFAAMYSPTFEELHFRDSLFSEWMFDPDEDLTFFEFLLLFPFLFFCLYVWFFHRRKKKHYRAYLRFFIPARRTIFSGWWVEDILKVPVGEWGRYFLDKMRHHTAPDVKFRSVHKFRMYRKRQKFKLMQLIAFHFENMRLRLYRDTLRNWENFTAKSVKFLTPSAIGTKIYMNPTVRAFKKETYDWAMLGDWHKFFFKPEPTPERIAYKFEHLQVDLSRLINKFIYRRRKKFRRSLWRTVQHIPGHLSMPYYPKKWRARFNNIYIYFPVNNVKYNYSYYNYLGWRNNRSRWRRYASTPSNVADQVFEFSRSLQRKDYNFYKRWQRRRRLMRVFQF